MIVMTRNVVNRANSPWHVKETLSIIVRDLEFENDGARLSGTVYLPSKGKKLPGVVVLHGAGGPSQNSSMYYHLREGLPRMGIGVLVFDRRGTGKSSGSSKRNSYETLADDAIAGQNALGKLPSIDPNNVGFWGISQGGWIAVLAASRSKRPSFAIPVSSPLVTPEIQMEFATSNLLKVRGYSQKDVREMLNARKAWLAYLEGKNSLASAINKVRRMEEKSWFKLAFIPRSKELQSSQGALKELYYDPLVALNDVHVPMFFIYGSEDPWIPVEESLKKLREIVRKQNNITYTLIPRANHEMMFKDRENMAFDKKVLNASAPESPSYFMEMSMWLSKHVKN
jgi:uncharacterized protein